MARSVATTVRPARDTDLSTVGQMLHDFNREFGDPAPEPAWLADRIGWLLAGGDTAVLVAGEPVCASRCCASAPRC